MLKLHLGCGNVHLSGFRNIDRRYQPGVDEVNNIGLLQHYEPNSVDEIYACHCLDHFDRWTYKTVLRRWFDLLKPGGVLRISTPDFFATMQHYAFTGDLAGLQGQLYASQDYDGNCRKWAWDFPLASDELKDIGFHDVNRYDPFEWLMNTAPGVHDASTLTWDSEPKAHDQRRYRSLNITARTPE